MASRAKAKAKTRAGGKGDGDGGGNRLRLPRVEEGDEAAAVVNLSEAKKELQELKEEVRDLKSTIRDLEDKMRELVDSNGESFNDLNSFQRSIHTSPKEYYESLKEECTRLTPTLVALTNSVCAASELIAQAMQNHPRYWLVEGTIFGIKKMKGIRAYIYAAAADYAGVAAIDLSPEGMTDRKDVIEACISYDGTDLKFSILFHSVEYGHHFANRLYEHEIISPNLEIEDPVVKHLSGHTFAIRRADYDTDKASSPPFSQVASSYVSNAEPNEPLTKFQSIEATGFLTMGYDIEKAHLVHASEIRKRIDEDPDEAFEDNGNNRLVMTSVLHKVFDGKRNGSGQTHIPLILIEAVDGLPDSAPNLPVEEIVQSDRTTIRERVWLKLSAFDEETMSSVIPRIKANSFLHNSELTGEREFFTFVHVVNPDVFKANVEWKAEETRKHWRQARREE